MIRECGALGAIGIRAGLACGQADRVSTKTEPGAGAAPDAIKRLDFIRTFDDTNPTKEDVEYVDAIREDAHWLGFDWEWRE